MRNLLWMVVCLLVCFGFVGNAVAQLGQEHNHPWDVKVLGVSVEAGYSGSDPVDVITVTVLASCPIGQQATIHCSVATDVASGVDGGYPINYEWTSAHYHLPASTGDRCPECGHALICDFVFTCGNTSSCFAPLWTRYPVRAEVRAGNTGSGTSMKTNYLSDGFTGHKDLCFKSSAFSFTVSAEYGEIVGWWDELNFVGNVSINYALFKHESFDRGGPGFCWRARVQSRDCLQNVIYENDWSVGQIVWNSISIFNKIADARCNYVTLGEYLHAPASGSYKCFLEAEFLGDTGYGSVIDSNGNPVTATVNPAVDWTTHCDCD